MMESKYLPADTEQRPEFLAPSVCNGCGAAAGQTHDPDCSPKPSAEDREPGDECTNPDCTIHFPPPEPVEPTTDDCICESLGDGVFKANPSCPLPEHRQWAADAEPVEPKRWPDELTDAQNAAIDRHTPDPADEAHSPDTCPNPECQSPERDRRSRMTQTIENLAYRDRHQAEVEIAALTRRRDLDEAWIGLNSVLKGAWGTENLNRLGGGVSAIRRAERVLAALIAERKG